jgi:sirohydrochlorin cobaltochelatase
MQTPESILILAAHGSSHESARAALEGFARRAALAFPLARTLLAYTAFRGPGNHPSVLGGRGLREVLAGLGDIRGATLAVQSLHVIAGDEFERTRQELLRFALTSGARLAVSGPLLASAADAPEVARALAESLGEAGAASPCRDGGGATTGASPLTARPGMASPGEALVLMGHGTTHEAQALYRALAASLETALPAARLGVLEAADPDDPLCVKAIARYLAARGVTRARLIPLLTVAGRHAHKDLAGDQPGSWKSVLAAHGVTCAPDLAGLIEREAFARLWLSRVPRPA